MVLGFCEIDEGLGGRLVIETLSADAHRFGRGGRLAHVLIEVFGSETILEFEGVSESCRKGLLLEIDIKDKCDYPYEYLFLE